MMQQGSTAIRTVNITKSFDKVLANDNISLEIRYGEILALLGENGSGKTTFMNMLSGIYMPDSGEIYANGSRVMIANPRDAFDLRIGMVHQHFKLVDVLTAAENVVLGMSGNKKYARGSINKEVRDICDRYGFDVDPNKKVYNMSVSEKQAVEIIKVLYRGADILVLDEPTAVLTPQESGKLFDILKVMKAENKAVVIVTHKLHEVLSISDRVCILRKGALVGDIATSEANEKMLAEKMVGRSVSLEIDRPQIGGGGTRLEAKNLTCLNGEKVKAVDDVSFELHGGEILGVAGIAGSGQKELCEALTGLHQVSGGDIFYYRGEGENAEKLDLSHKSPSERRRLGISMGFVPEDRLGTGLVAPLDITDNVMLRGYERGRSIFVDRKSARAQARELVERLEIKTPGIDKPIRLLSGGNIQKVLLGREIASVPGVLIVAYPTRGLDINSSYTIYDLINDQKKKGVAVLFIGEDLDVLLELCDRIMVLCGGRVSGTVDASRVTKEELGLMMAGQAGGDNTERSS